jgi:ferredoxin
MEGQLYDQEKCTTVFIHRTVCPEMFTKHRSKLETQNPSTEYWIISTVTVTQSTHKTADAADLTHLHVKAGIIN